jgi:NAD(P)-dependent dehydrogenase (short-subunit alcohol dehydrogenase family)
MNLLSIAGFTNLGYRVHARSFEESRPDMSAKTVLITGATGGLGKATARSLADLGARVIAVGRDAAKLDALREELTGDVVTARADLSLLAEIHRLAGTVLESEPRLDVLINNVGVLLPGRQVTEEGLETTLATNPPASSSSPICSSLISSRPRRPESSMSARAGCTPRGSAPTTSNSRRARIGVRWPMPGPSVDR